MSRLFREHRIRECEILDGAWNFAADPSGVGIDEGWQNGFEGTSTVVPSVWNTKGGLEEYEGACWYSRELYTEGGTLRFVFGSVLTEARVWLDGEYLGSHYGGFCQFELTKRNVSKGEHRLTVRVDNSFDSRSIPQSGVDWYHYGGITRQVSVERLDGICVLAARLEYTLSPKLDSADCRVALTLFNSQDIELTDSISVRLLGKELSVPVTLKAGEMREICTQDFTISGFELWSTDNPRLYALEVSSSTDDLYDRVGFRLVEVKSDGVYLNGRHVELLGVNRHEEHPDFGFAFPEALMERDIDIAVKMGCNTIRGAHYPNNPLFVDMLDERGILFYSEIPIWGGGFAEETLKDSDVLLRGEQMHREMVEHYYNHPSIIIWGMHNEILTETEAGIEMSRRYYTLLKEIGGNRIVTFATNRPLKDECLEYCDIISINMYIGWYGSKDERWEDFLSAVKARRDSLGYADKPILMSEFGAGAVYGHRSFEGFRWSEEYQAKLVGECIELFHSDSAVAGSLVWHFADARTQFDLTRARGYNNKGVLSEYRHPKAAYFKVAELYNRYQKESKTNTRG